LQLYRFQITSPIFSSPQYTIGLPQFWQIGQFGAGHGATSAAGSPSKTSITAFSTRQVLISSIVPANAKSHGADAVL